MRFTRFALCLLALLTGCVSLSEKNQEAARLKKEASARLQFAVSFPESVRREPATGRLLLFFTRAPNVEPRSHINWFKFEPVFAVDLTNLPPGEAHSRAISLEDFDPPGALAFPTPMRELPAGDYYVQALFDIDNTERDWNEGPGNLFSTPAKIHLPIVAPTVVPLIMNTALRPPAPPKEDEWLKYVEIKSERLSAFHHRDIFMRATVLLPSQYQTNAEQKFPTIYSIPGFGGRHTEGMGRAQGSWGERWKHGEWPFQAIMIFLDPSVPLGHSVFANSDNNGPVGDALVHEFIPEIEKRFRAIPRSEGRVVTGHSSGGWSSLWLQVAYPEVFGACWSSSPDPVDFSAFQTMNIYKDSNGHWSQDGQLRALARNQHKPLLTFAEFNHWEYVTGPGGQLDSFNAVFSKRGSDGRPEPLMDKLSGEINHSVADQWKRYDIRMILEQNWAELAPKLHGKIHIICGSWDTYYLDTAVRELKDFLSQTDYGGYVEFYPGDHSSAITDTVTKRIEQEMKEFFLRLDTSTGR